MAEQTKKAWLRRTFKLDIVMVLSSLIICTMLVITSFTYFQNRKEALHLAGRIMSDKAQTVIAETTDYLAPARIVATLGAELMSSDETVPKAGGALERYLVRALSEYPQIGLAYFGDMQGNFLMVRREASDNTLTTRQIDRTGPVAMEQLTFRDRAGDPTRLSMGANVTYDPRERPWFKGAVAAGDLYWTDVYIFSTGKMPGITAAVPAAVSKPAVPNGVLGADVTLIQLSEFLDGLDISPNGLAFVIDDLGQVIAFPGIVPVSENNGEIRPLLATELDNAWVTAAVRQYVDTRDKKFEFSSDGETSLAFVQPFPEGFGKNWNTVVLVPVDDFVGPIKRNSLITLGLSFLVLLVAIFLGIRFSRNIARPVELLTEQLNQVRDFRLGEPSRVRSYIHEIQMMERSINSMKNGLAAFRKYVPAGLVRDLIASGEEAQPGGKERELTVLFTDITNFTPIAETMTPRETMVCLSDYFDVLCTALDRTKGTVDKYIGDSIMAFWGAPVPDEDHALHCCEAVLNAIEKLELLNAERAEAGEKPLVTRFGIHTGFMIVGNVGSSERLNYTAIGDNVNLASRLEDVNKLYGTTAILSQNTYRYVRSRFICRPLDLIVVRGRSEGVKIYELLARRGEIVPVPLVRKADMFAEAFELYLARDWVRALELFQEVAKLDPADRPAQMFITRCEALIADPPGNDWTGISRIDVLADT